MRTDLTPEQIRELEITLAKWEGGIFCEPIEAHSREILDRYAPRYSTDQNALHRLRQKMKVEGDTTWRRFCLAFERYFNDSQVSDWKYMLWQADVCPVEQMLAIEEVCCDKATE